MLSHGRMSASQPGHREGGETTERPAGRRWMQTFPKLPAARPSRNAVTSKAGVRSSRVQSGKGGIKACSEASWGPSPRESRGDNQAPAGLSPSLRSDFI